MNQTNAPHHLPLRFRLAWTLLWLAVLGALALFGRDSAAPSPVPGPALTLPQLREAWIHNEGDGAATAIDERIRHQADGGARGAAFRQP
jgi:hypothetical protein